MSSRSSCRLTSPCSGRNFSARILWQKSRTRDRLWHNKSSNANVAHVYSPRWKRETVHALKQRRLQLPLRQFQSSAAGCYRAVENACKASLSLSLACALGSIRRDGAVSVSFGTGQCAGVQDTQLS